MATVQQLVEMMATVTMTERKSVNVYARALIDAGALPKSSGRAVAHVRAEHAAKLLLALALKPKIKTVGLYVDVYSRLVAMTNMGPLTAIAVIRDMFGAASAGGIRDREWGDVSITVYDTRLGIDIHLPASPDGGKGDRVLRFRLPAGLDVDEIERFVLEPNPFFARSAHIPFEALLFTCQLMRARQPEATPEGTKVVDRLRSLAPIAEKSA